MLELSCSACGAHVGFRSKASVFAVCSFCKSTLVRHDMNLETVGKMAELQYELTPFQIGTTGMFQEQKFEIIGRLKVAYEDGFWNEWYVMAGDKVGWLAEAQGFLAMCFELEETEHLPPVTAISIGKLIELKPQGYFEVDDMRRVHCIYSEGELPFDAPQGRRSMSVDLSGPDRRMATIEYGDSVRVYTGQYRDFDDFAFQNLRRIDGW